MKYLASKYAGASTRYYTTRTALPWLSVANGGVNCYSGGAILTTIPVTSPTTCTASSPLTWRIETVFHQLQIPGRMQHLLLVLTLESKTRVILACPGSIDSHLIR